jgi:FkbM family methyltransferase
LICTLSCCYDGRRNTEKEKGLRRRKRIIGNFFSGPLFQPAWEALHKLSLHRMNYGRGATVEGGGERWVLRYLKEIFRNKEHLVVFDVGANIGQYTTELLQCFGSKADIFCFEPNTATFNLLTQNMAGKSNVRCYNFGLSDKDHEAVLYSNGETSGMASLYDRHLGHAGITMAPTTTVSLTTLDGFCRRDGIDQIDFMKIDVEGHELSVFRGASEIVKSITFIQFEFGDCNVDSRTYFRDLFEMLNPNYDIYRVLHHGLKKIRRYNESLEIFKVTNYFAVLRNGTEP